MDTDPEFVDAVTDPAFSGPELYPWDSGPAVAELQELLNAHGFRLEIDSDFGGRTEAAVRAYQHQHGLRIDGVVDCKTWAALKTTVQPGARILKQGHTGADVRELQGLLQVCGHSLCRDGVFGADTKRAVIAFQLEHQLEHTGDVNPVTWIVLRGRVTSLPTPPRQTGWFFDSRKWW